MTLHQIVAIFNHETDEQGNLVPWYAAKEKQRNDRWRGRGLTAEQIAEIERNKEEINEFTLKANTEMGQAINLEVAKYRCTLGDDRDAEQKANAFREEVEERHLAEFNRKLTEFRREQLKRRSGKASWRPVAN